MLELARDQIPYVIVLALAVVCLIGAFVLHRYRDKSR
jgi:hypothetical protein